MRIILFTGGARSGKSARARALALELGGDHVTFVATARPPGSDGGAPQPGPGLAGGGRAGTRAAVPPSAGHPRPPDPEMARRVARHRASRPRAWTTVEGPEAAIRGVADAGTGVVLLDCLTLLVSDAVVRARERGEEEAVHAGAARIDALLEAAASREGTLIVVTNEVGSGVVPPAPLGRWFRDAQGIANRRVAAAADRAVLVVAGRTLELE